MSELVDELRNHIAMMPEHVLSRASGKLLIRCRDELTEQSERVKALEALLLRVEAKIRTTAGYTIDLQKQWDAVRFADELAAVLRDSTGETK